MEPGRSQLYEAYEFFWSIECDVYVASTSVIGTHVRSHICIRVQCWHWRMVGDLVLVK